MIANASDRFQPRITPIARAINDGMPLHMADLAVEALREAGVDISDARIAVLGYAYLENSDDTRSSPSEGLMVRLRELGAEVVIHDPWVAEFQGDLQEVIQGCDAVVLMVKHDQYVKLDPMELIRQLKHPVIVDGRQVFHLEQIQSTEIVSKIIGVGR